MDKKPEINRPIFMVGTGRSGSTMIFEALSVHPDLGWLSNYNKLLPWFGFVSIMPRIYNIPFFSKRRGQKKQYNQGKGFLNRLMPTPFECYWKWDLLCEKFEFDFLKDKTASDKEKKRVKKAVRQILFWQSKKRFAAKITGPTRMTFLKSIFPDAVFVHIKRHPIAVIMSSVDFGFWKPKSEGKLPRWDGGLPENWREEWKQYGQSKLALIAIQYRTIMKVCREERKQLNENDYTEIDYEDFIDEPVEVMHRICSFCDLPNSQKVDEFIRNQKYINGNKKYLEKITPKQKKVIENILGDSQ